MNIISGNGGICGAIVDIFSDDIWYALGSSRAAMRYHAPRCISRHACHAICAANAPAFKINAAATILGSRAGRMASVLPILASANILISPRYAARYARWWIIRCALLIALYFPPNAYHSPMRAASKCHHRVMPALSFHFSLLIVTSRGRSQDTELSTGYERRLRCFFILMIYGYRL